MTASLKLPLRLSVSKRKDDDSLQSRIFQINSQKGAFRNITEASLREGIRSGKQQDGQDTSMAGVEDSEAEQPENQYETIIKRREEMMQQLRRAQNDTLMSLDFISLLLSKHAPNTAKSTMSPTLQAAVPIETLDARIMKYTAPTPSEARSAELVSRAYKLQGFSDVADKILVAASRLEDEATKEQQYWEQILSIKRKGWAISKVPRDPRTLGVHFGFRDAAPFFRNRGFAALRRDADGGLRLDHGAVPSRPVAVQVSILRNGRNCGSSAISPSHMATKEAIDEQILQARNTLYEEELFFELGREARSLANQGATMSSKQIRMPVDEQTQLQIDLINSDHHSSSNIAAGSDQQLADGIAISLRILLAHAHEQNLRRRSQPPPPMTLKSRPIPEYALLRPIIAHLQHRNHVKSLTNFLQTITQPLKSAGTRCDVQSTTSPLDTLTSVSSSSSSSTTVTPNAILQTLTHPLTTTLTLHLPTASHSLNLTISTNLSPPLLGTEYSFSPQTLTYHSSSSSSPTPLTLPTLSNLDEVEILVRRVLTIDLVECIASHCTATATAVERRGKGKEEKEEEDDDEDLIAGMMGIEKRDGAGLGTSTEEERWKPLDPYEGALARGKERLYIRVWNDRLGMRYLKTGDGDGDGNGKGRGRDMTAYLWDGSEKMEVGDVRGRKRSVERRSLFDIVKEAGEE
ncbi:hypothetical protein GJ744_004081 [Endocarpon pusillum]|uniref:Mediator of RNA polymerase II transcription subunit 17 n=1 Tax=Endocarpon pusillum TaxID=364733 RepID=A0A8H7ALT6_9EURO|nr:hypothetical protein GJ744_004081 [Endocarpon pusillum]